MTFSPKKTILITFVSFILFYLISLESMMLEYAPSSMAIYILRYGLFIFFVVSFLYLIFIYKSKFNEGKTAWEKITESLTKFEKTKHIAKFSLAILFFVLMVFCIQRWMAYPTKWFASSFVVKELHCVQSSKLGNTHRNRVTIETTSLDGKEDIKFPWPTDKAPECPGDIEVIGYEWFWGTYVTSVKKREEKALDKEPELFIYR